MNKLSAHEMYGEVPVSMAAAARAPRAAAQPADLRLAAFNSAPRLAHRSRGQKVAGATVAIGVQVLFLCGLFYGTMHEAMPKLEALSVVNLLEEEQVVEETPPPPPPRIDVPVMQIAPPVVAITITEPPPPTAPTAVIAETPRPLPPPARAIGPDGERAIADFQRTLLRHLNRHKRYPPGARAKREQGVVYIRFAMDRRGHVLSAGIERPSRIAPLDEEGLALLRRAEPLPTPPAEVAGDPVEFIVPVEFSLR